jgi:molybdopterin/thiamine biosynthesis adenylyltransferase
MRPPIEELAREGALPDGTPVRILRHGAVREAAQLLQLSLRQAEILALNLGLIPERYLRNFKTLDCAAQARLLGAKVALVGLGGLGGPILEGLARLGFGPITAAGPALFAPTNLHRPSLAIEETLGRSKAQTAQARVEQVNPAVEFSTQQVFLESEAFATFFAGADVAVDALGGMASRPAAERGAARAGVPLVTAAVAGWTVMAATVLPGAQGPATLFGATSGQAGPAAEDALGCLAPAI